MLKHVDNFKEGEKMNKYQIEQIMEQDRHMFIYRNNDGKNDKQVEDLEFIYPVVSDNNKPIAVYLGNYSLPIIENKNNNIDKNHLGLISQEHFNFSIGERVVDRLLSSNIKEDKTEKLVDMINKIYMNNNDKLKDLESLKKILKEAKDFYEEYYVSYLNNKQLPSINNLKIPFLDAMSILEYSKRMLKNNSHFALVVNRTSNMATISERAINGIVSRRCNDLLSMKVFTSIEDWKAYYDLNGELIEETHDYGTIELDDNIKQYVKKMKNKNGIN